MAFLLANWRLVLFSLVLVALGIQTARLNISQAEFKTYQAEIEKQVAENKAKAAQESARMAHNATKALDDLQVRLTALGARYKRLRDSRSTPAVPALSDAASLFGSCPGNPSQPDTVAESLGRLEAGVLGILEAGDAELAKYAELWKLQQKNSK